MLYFIYIYIYILYIYIYIYFIYIEREIEQCKMGKALVNTTNFPSSFGRGCSQGHVVLIIYIFVYLFIY